MRSCFRDISAHRKMCIATYCFKSLKIYLESISVLPLHESRNSFTGMISSLFPTILLWPRIHQLFLASWIIGSEHGIQIIFTFDVNYLILQWIQGLPINEHDPYNHRLWPRVISNKCSISIVWSTSNQICLIHESIPFHSSVRNYQLLLLHKKGSVLVTRRNDHVK